MEICEEYQIPYEVIDTLEEPEKAGQELVLSVPTIIFLDEENRELRRFFRIFWQPGNKRLSGKIFFRIGWARNININRRHRSFIYPFFLDKKGSPLEWPELTKVDGYQL